MPPIVGFFHICQKKGWKLSFDLIFATIYNSGLYEASSIIYLVVLNDTGMVDDERFHKDIFNVSYGGKCSLYERATLRKMMEISQQEPSHFWYAHTKGLKYISTNTSEESNVIDWIKLMCHFNFTLWKDASYELTNVNVCGCNFRDTPLPHFSGNFWWATSDYIKTLPKSIGSRYLDPEMWLFRRNPTYRCLHDSKLLHYDSPYKPHNYIKPRLTK